MEEAEVVGAAIGSFPRMFDRRSRWDSGGGIAYNLRSTPLSASGLDASPSPRS